MAAASDEELQKAQAGQISYTDYLLSLLETEARHREEEKP
jgi:hypothetical protein